MIEVVSIKNAVDLIANKAMAMGASAKTAADIRGTRCAIRDMVDKYQRVAMPEDDDSSTTFLVGDAVVEAGVSKFPVYAKIGHRRPRRIAVVNVD